MEVTKLYGEAPGRTKIKHYNNVILIIIIIVG